MYIALVLLQYSVRILVIVNFLVSIRIAVPDMFDGSVVALYACSQARVLAKFV